MEVRSVLKLQLGIARGANVLNAWKAARAASEAEVAAITKWEAEVWLPFRAKHSSVAMP
jgi:hypothetical protein